MILRYFDDIIESEDGMRFLLKLPYKSMMAILTSDKLNIRDEKVLIKLLEKFCEHRYDLPLPDEDNMVKTYVANLTMEETAAREILRLEEFKVSEDLRLEKEKNVIDMRAALTTEESKVDFDMKIKVDLLHKLAAANLKIVKLSKRQ